MSSIFTHKMQQKIKSRIYLLHVNKVLSWPCNSLSHGWIRRLHPTICVTFGSRWSHNHTCFMNGGSEWPGKAELFNCLIFILLSIHLSAAPWKHLRRGNSEGALVFPFVSLDTAKTRKRVVGEQLWRWCDAAGGRLSPRAFPSVAVKNR